MKPAGVILGLGVAGFGLYLLHHQAAAPAGALTPAPPALQPPVTVAPIPAIPASVPYQAGGWTAPGGGLPIRGFDPIRPV